MRSNFSSSTTASLASRLRRALLTGAALVLLGLSACGGSDELDRGPTTLPVSAALNGLYWDVGTSRLYLTDDATNTIRVWDGDKSFASSMALPSPPASGVTLGQIAGGKDGTLYVTRFGFGTDGTVIAVPKMGAAVNLKGLDATRRRIGLAIAPDGALIDGWFIKGGAGALSLLTVNGVQASETELVTGLGKPVGVAVAGDQLFVSDQNTGNVLSYSLSRVRAKPATLADGKVLATFTTLDGIDLMTAASDGTLFFGGSGGRLFQLSPKGEVKVLATGWPKVRGVAYDEANRRLFVAVVAADASSQSSIRIVPIN
ncbi:hypothetical protein [Ottowia sp.]|uniref:SMP-30/gluconolactonase/LRE family protein n=1 Tax=Ottowia sp. TaxID=1898956 RepID=UPI002BD36337|nr:hypothetical protein [Ottowia sp.]HOB66224.1 hypothetical protein [Ottowia sp.]HPZ56688.1 hypothetical protein [Ottowia sp.]HQD47242.1 hypothetical protein [Ottowia sp.]